MDKCQTCKWWDKAGSPPPVNHRCFRYPPVRIFNGEEDETQWPWTAPTDYCGEYTPDEGERQRRYRESMRGDY